MAGPLGSMHTRSITEQCTREAAIREALRLARAELRSGSLVKSLFVLVFKRRFKSAFGVARVPETGYTESWLQLWLQNLHPSVLQNWTRTPISVPCTRPEEYAEAHSTMVKVFSNVRAPVGSEAGHFSRPSTCENQLGARTPWFAEGHGVNGFRVRCWSVGLNSLVNLSSAQ